MKHGHSMLAVILLRLVCVIFPSPGHAEENTPYLILWNVPEKTGQILKMEVTDENGGYTLHVPVVRGSYTWRVAIGANKQPIYGAGGEKGGKPIPLDVDANRIVHFTFDPQTHLLTATLGEPFIPPRRVVLVGNLQDEFGHTGGPFGGPWDPAAETTRMTPHNNNLFTFTGTLPAGTYEYKIAIGGNWKENYGQDGKQDGSNIGLTIPQEQEVTFYYNDTTHKIADSTWYKPLAEEQLPRLVGNVQKAADTELMLMDDDFDQIYALRLSLKPGTYTTHILFGGATYPETTFTLPAERLVSFYFDTHTRQTIVDDGSIAENMLNHDTFNLAYRTPFEAIKTGESLTLKLHARKGDIQQAKLIVSKADIIKGQRQYKRADREYPLALLATQLRQDSGEVDVWGVTLTFDEPGLYGYKFVLNDLKEYGDDAKAGGIGIAALRGAAYFPLTVYAADFTTPDWLKEAIIYQIFPDRFFNGNPQNDTAKSSARGTEPVVLHTWNEMPSAPTLHNDADQFWNNDFFGGDLDGIRQKLDYLQRLGVTVLYLNPIFTAASNHKYDTADYDHIDPMFGADEDFVTLTKELRQRGMFLILDGVFNHVGDDSIYFDRYGKYPYVGAYEYWSRVYDNINTNMLRVADAKVAAERQLLVEGQQFSPYNWHTWFTVNNKMVQRHYEYQGWSGYDSLPVFQEPGPDDVENPAVAYASELNNRAWADYMLYDANSVAKRWLTLGSSGWRLDVAPEVDPAFWRAFRQEVKAFKLPSGDIPAIIGETWQDAAHFFLGDQFDSVMNYGFRYAVLDRFLLNGDAAGAELVLQSMRQNYPKEACAALMNLIGSHDTVRAIYLLGGGEDKQVIAQAGQNFDADLGQRRLKLAALFQMGYPGAPAIYYGDEVGLTGARDPDCRRPYPWGQENQDVLAYYRTLTGLRMTHKTLFVQGDLATLYAEGDVYVYVRKSDTQSAIVAINRGNEGTELTLTVQGHLADDLVLSDALDSAYATPVANGCIHLVLPPETGRMLLSDEKNAKK